MTKQAKKKAPALDVPQSQVQAEELLFNIGVAQRRITVIEAAMNDVLARARQEFEAEAQPINVQIDQWFEALHAWAEANKETLLVGKLKTARLSTGELAWRTSPPAVRVTDVDSVLDRLRKLQLERFIRTKTEVNKEAVLAEPDAVDGVKGITITQKEEFVAKPFETQMEKATPAVTSKTEVLHG